MEFKIIHNHERFTNINQYMISDVNSMVNVLTDLYNTYENEEADKHSKLELDYIGKFCELIQHRIKVISDNLKEEYSEDNDMDPEYKQILLISKHELSELSDQVVEVLRNIISNTKKMNPIDFMKMIMDLAKDNNVDCFIATETGSMLYGDHTKFHAKDLHLLLFGEEMPEGYKEKVLSEEKKDDVMKVVRKPEKSKSEEALLMNVNRYTFGDVINWIMSVASVILLENPNNYYFIVATDVILSIHLGNIQWKRIDIYQSPSMSTEGIKKIAKVEMKDSDEAISIFAVDNKGFAINRSEIQMRKIDWLNGTRWWDKSEFKNVFIKVELVLTAMLSLPLEYYTALRSIDTEDHDTK